MNDAMIPSEHTVKQPNTMPLGGKQNDTVLRGHGIRGPVFGPRALTGHRKKRGKERWHGIRGDTVFGGPELGFF